MNHAPSITGKVAEYARVGENYSSRPDAVDVDGDALHFSAENLPPWASINPDDGRITGTPGNDDLGIYELITITVADAAHHSVTQPFSITVIGDTGTGVASLRWEIPASKFDGSPLDDLAGYRILYGHSTDDLDKCVIINDPAATSFEFSTLTSGVWYFAVVAVNSGGLEGPPTIVASKSI